VNREVAVGMLENLGYRTETAANGMLAMEAVTEGSYAAVLMDCQMPVMDGFEATRRIRAMSHASIPIIAVTADAMPADRDRCLSQGMNDYISKPVELEQLAHVLAKWLPASGKDATAPLPLQRVFDVERLLWRLQGDRQLARITLNGFLHDAPAQLSNLRMRLDEADAPGVRSQAQVLRGAAAMVAAEGLRAIALAMEQTARTGQLDSCGDLLPRALEEFARFRTTLERGGWVDRNDDTGYEENKQ